MENKITYHWQLVASAISGEFHLPITCEVDLSNRCMLDCSFCLFKEFLLRERVDLPVSVYNKFLSEAWGLRSITFAGGGEPLMNPNFNLMVRSALVRDIEVGLVTNGVLLDKVEDVTCYNFIRVSLDASNAEVYKRIKKVDIFDRVVRSIKRAVQRGAFVGISYVVNEENKDGVNEARELAEQLNTKYIQFKPAWINGSTFRGFEKAVEKANAGVKNIVTARDAPTDTLPCKIAGLIGILSANGCYYYCCHHRGKPNFNLGSAEKLAFTECMKKRDDIFPDVTKCPQCRYMNYAIKYRQLNAENKMNIRHINFL